jgi:hypothetical protein
MKESDNMPRGRPKKIKSKEELENKINNYFESCFRPILNKEFNYINDENGNIIKEQIKPFTICGLADALDMSRQSLLNYQKEEKFFDTIMRAKRKCEVYAEERLFDRDGVNGAKFSLINNYENWEEKNKVETTIKNNPVDELINSIEELKNENK